ncbi:MAG: hypothetical protein ACKVWR_14540, partial [Acidimicrobiales bacterium]
RRAAPAAAGEGGWLRRVAVRPDPIGPKGRLSALWVVTAVAAALISPLALAVHLATAAGLAGLQSADRWRRRRQRPARLVAGLGGAALPLAAGFGVRPLGAAALVLALAALVAARLDPRALGRLGAAGCTVRCSLFTGLAAASVVMLGRLDTAAAIAVLVLSAAYDAGWHLVGVGAPRALDGPAAGVIGVLAFTFALSVLLPDPFTAQGAWWAGLAAAALAPLGQLAASLVLPDPSARAPALRRLDSLLLTAPVWAVALWVNGAL